MFSQVKQITFITLILFMSFTLSAQDIDTVVYSEADSLQDVMLEQLEQQLKVVNSRLWQINLEQQEKTDSLELVNNKLAEQIIMLAEESENLEEMLSLAETEIANNDQKLQNSRKKFKRALFIAIPSLLFITITLSMLLFLLVNKHKTSTELKMSALRRYTTEGIEEVRNDYVNEIKRRVKKIAAKLKPPKKEKGKRKKEKKNKEKKKK